MSPWMLFVVTALYAWCTGEQAMAGQYGLAIFLGGCSIANVGILLMAKG